MPNVLDCIQNGAFWQKLQPSHVILFCVCKYANNCRCNEHQNAPSWGTPLSGEPKDFDGVYHNVGDLLATINYLSFFLFARELTVRPSIHSLCSTLICLNSVFSPVMPRSHNFFCLVHCFISSRPRSHHK